MPPPTFYTLKKTFFHAFFPSKATEELTKRPMEEERRPVPEEDPLPERKLVEIRRLPRVTIPPKPWPIKKPLNEYEVLFGRIFISSDDTFDHVIHYWSLDKARNLTDDGAKKVGVTLWDITQAGDPIKYPKTEVYIQKQSNDEFVVACERLIQSRKLKVGDEIHLSWDSRNHSFIFRSVPRNTP